MILIMPLPQMLATITMASARMASHQLLLQFWTAEPERDIPMRMMMGPVTTGGRKRMTFLTPATFIMKASTRYSRPATTMPPQA